MTTTTTKRSFLLVPLLLCLLTLAISSELDLCVKRCHEEDGGLVECTMRCERQDGYYVDPTADREDPRRVYQLCQKRCDRQEREHTRRTQCRDTCRREFERAQREAGARGQRNPTRREEEEGAGRGERSVSNPYHFDSNSFRYWFRSTEGSFRVLPKFTERSRRLFKGIENYRVAFLEAQPNTFLVPQHFDADSVCFFLRGRGTVTFVSQNTKESFNVEEGHAVRVPAGTTFYLTNTDGQQTLQVAKLYVPINTPGSFEGFFVAGGQNHQSYLRGFSDEVLEASFNVPREQLERVWRSQQQDQGIFRRASQEQIRELSRHASSPRGQRGHGTRWTPFDLTGQQPTHSNRFGQLYEARPEDFRQLEDLDISVSLANITQGSMFAPHYNSRTTFFVFVARGKARIEMACPHVSSQQWQEEQQQGRSRREWGEEEREEEQRKGQIHRIRSDVSRGDLFIVPAGHPVAFVASDSSFQAVGFGINARNNRRNFLAGEENIMKRMDREAKQLAFGVGGEQAEKVFERQKESYFVPARQSRQVDEPGHHPTFQSIVDAVGF